MTRILVADTTNIQLDWLVAKLEGKLAEATQALKFYELCKRRKGIVLTHHRLYSPTSNPYAAYVIILREHIGLVSPSNSLTLFWKADIGFEGKFTQFDHDPLISAMRCFVASRLGPEVEIPEELL